jgi:hypothetical protein
MQIGAFGAIEGAKKLEILLPFGSSEGSYDVRIKTTNGAELFEGSSIAQIQEGITAMHVETNLAAARPGLLEIQQPDREVNEYPLLVR